ncbi:VQ motif containing protein [Quillaja saponaria]|uniref:VQ motif containing protein n=1 Tax=Quillaja saponaria TaxID=32244 RepID=A0AAD7LL29_QUISA|nr:VQ motif containing protein [Quillaja saponaria]
MDFPDIPTGKSPRRELQGPRPTPLKVRKDSHKIKKPPLAPQPAAAASQQPQAPPRQPVIIYTVSPKIIHTTPSDFMTLVQRLTGSNSSSFSNPMNDANNNGNSGAISPAARYATIEKAAGRAADHQGKKQHQPQHQSEDHDHNIMEGIEMKGDGMQGMGLFHGILSPGPASLSPIPASFFSPLSSDPGSFSNFFHDLSPVLHGNRNFLEGSFMPNTPSTTFVSQAHMISMTSPTPSIDLFNIFSGNNY